MMHKGQRIQHETIGPKGLRYALGILPGVGKRFMPGTFSAPHPGRYPLLNLALSCLCLLLPCGWQALPAESLSEAQIKAAYLYNFAKFVEWPAEVLPPGAEMVLCVVGNNVLDGALQALDGRQAGGRSLRVVSRSHADLNPNGCHLLFIGSSEQSRFVLILKDLRAAPVLTLSDIDDFAEKGGGISLLFRENKVVFEVNLEPIRNARLHVPGQLLNIASTVYGR